MIFTFGAPDLYVLPSDVPSSTHPQKESNDSGLVRALEEKDILSIRISYCNSYIFILTKRVLFAYSNGNELVYLGRLTLSEAGFSEFGNFRDLVILPVSNLLGLLVDNAKHLLVVNYQNPNLSEASLANTPVQTPTNRSRYNNSGFSSENALNPDNSPAHIGPTPLTTTPVASANVNRRFSTGNILSALNRIFRPSDDEVEELRDSFDLYLKNFVKFRLMYDVLVPSDFSFVFVVNQQFVFWTKELSGLYSTISNEGFLNLLINDLNTFKRKVDEVKRISLYLLTTNLLNNVNIIGNIPLSYGLCYINLQSVTINNSRLLHLNDSNTSTNTSKSNEDSKENANVSNGSKDNSEDENRQDGDNSGDFYKNLEVYNEYDSLAQMIYHCVRNIHNTNPNNLIFTSTTNPDASDLPNDASSSLEKKRSIDADNILDLLEGQNKRGDGMNEGIDGNVDGEFHRGVEENLMKNVRKHFIVENKLYLLTSKLFMYINIHSPQDYENRKSDSRDNNKHKHYSSISSYVTACSRDFKEEDSPKKLEMGRLIYDDVEEVYINQENELICVIFKGNKIRTFYMKRLDKPISELELEKEVEDVCWSNNFLIVLTDDNHLHFYSYSLQELYSTPVDPSKKGTNQRPEPGIGIIRTFSNLTTTSVDSSEACGTNRSVVSSVVNMERGGETDTGTTELEQKDTSSSANTSKESDRSVVNTERSRVDEQDKMSKDSNGSKDNSEDKPSKKGRLLGINNNLKLLVYNRRLVVYNLYVNHSNVSDFNLFLNSNNILIISSSCFFSPTKSFGTTFNVNLSKDKRQMFTLKLPNLNVTDNEYSENMEEEQPCSIDDLVIKDIKINRTANYVLIHHARSCASGFSGTKSSSGIILYDNNYTYSNNPGVEVLAINWFTNHIFYLVVKIKDDKIVSKRLMPEIKNIPFKYYVSFYSINNMNDVLIDIPMKHRPVCTTTDKPYLFVALDEQNQLHCYDLFYIQYKMLYSININQLSWCEYRNNNGSMNMNETNKLNGFGEFDKLNGYNKSNDSNDMNKMKVSDKLNKLDVKDHGQYWKEIYVFGFKKFLLLDLYRELYLVDENHVYHLLSNVNQVVFNVSSSRNYQYLATTREGESYLLSNYFENLTNRGVARKELNMYGKKDNTKSTGANENSKDKDNTTDPKDSNEDSKETGDEDSKESDRSVVSSYVNTERGGDTDAGRTEPEHKDTSSSNNTNSSKENTSSDKASKNNGSKDKSGSNRSTTCSVTIKGKNDKPVMVMDVVKLMNNSNYILNINNDVMVLLNLNKNNISLIYTLLPVFLTYNYGNNYGNRMDDLGGYEKYDNSNSSNNNSTEHNQVRGREMLLLEYLIYYFNVLGEEESDKDEKSSLVGDKRLGLNTTKDSKNTSSTSNNVNKDDEASKRNEDSTYESKKTNEDVGREMMSKISKMMKNKLFSISCRKQNELERVLQLEEEFGLKSEDCFNYLLEEKEFEFASLLLLPLQIKTDPYFVRTQFCKHLIRELLSSIIQSTPQTGFKSRRNNQVLILMLIKFYNRLPLNEEDAEKSKFNQDNFNSYPVDKLLQDVENANESSSNDVNKHDEVKPSKTNEVGSKDTNDTDARDSKRNEENDTSRDDTNETSSTSNNVNEDDERREMMDRGRSSQGFGKGIDLVIDMNEFIEDLLLKLNFMPVYQLNFLDSRNKEKEEEKNSKNDKETSSLNKYPNYFNNELKDVVAGIVKLNTDFENLALNLVLYFMIEANHINYNILTTSKSKNTEFFLNKFFTEEYLKFYMLMGYNNYICLSDLVVNNPKITEFMIKIQESNCLPYKDPKKEKLNVLKSLLIKAITTYSIYPN